MLTKFTTNLFCPCIQSLRQWHCCHSDAVSRVRHTEKQILYSLQVVFPGWAVCMWECKCYLHTYDSKKKSQKKATLYVRCMKWLIRFLSVKVGGVHQFVDITHPSLYVLNNNLIFRDYLILIRLLK